MENLNNQLMNGLYLLLVSPPVDFLIHHSLIIGFITGVISLIPFVVKRLPHLIVVMVALFAAFFASNKLNLTFAQLLYSEKSYFIINMLGNYFIGCTYGLVIANLIQRIRGEHDHATNY